MIKAKKCLHCDNSIDHLRKDAKYCSNACKTSAYKERHNLNVRTEKGICQNPRCDNIIPANKKVTSKYCRPACRKAVFNKKKSDQLKFINELLKKAKKV